MKRFFLIPLAIVLMGILIFSGCSQQARLQHLPLPPRRASTPTPTTTTSGPIELKFAYWVPPVIPMAKLGWEGWGHEVTDATNGRVTVKYSGGAAMGAPQDHYDLVKSGTADIAMIEPSFTPGVFPLSYIAYLPMMFPSAEVAAGALYQFNKKYTFNGEFKDVKILAFSPTSPSQLLTNKVQVKTLEDLKGLKIAVTSPVTAEIMNTLGASAVFMPEGEVYTSLERGLVDGRVHEWDGAVVWKGMEVTKYRTGNINLSVNQMMVVMNWNSWNKLPADIQGIITGMTGLHYSRFLGLVFDRANEMNLGRATSLR